ncbi:MAG TPA: acetyl-CoA C-acyltransferase [Polyangiaceae bacterium]|nr:acetyl-CoA C-acyltransferase [Polyangiaceae bacterium]
MANESLFIVGAARTPIGAFLGGLSALPAPRLGAVAIRAALERAKVEPGLVEEVFMGNVLSAGIGQAPARQASIYAGLPSSVPCTTVNKVCGSGLQAAVLAARALLVGDAELAVAGGMESMSNAPYYLPNARGGYRIGDGKLVDGMMYDGLWDPYNEYPMGKAGELCAREYGFGREAQDAFAAESYRRANHAIATGAFKAEIASVSLPQKKGEPIVIDTDEEPGRGDPAKLPKLRPAFDAEGTITAGNASSIDDGAAAVVLATEAAVKRHNLEPLARIVGWGVAAQAPEWFTTAPAQAIERTLARTKLSTGDIDLWEVNEAFACVTLACARLAGLDLERVNVRGGAVALGHPIGASGARVLVTLIHALKYLRARRGLATLCIGGGEAVAMVVERT